MNIQNVNSPNKLIQDIKIAVAIQLISGRETSILKGFNIYNTFFVVILLNILVILFDDILAKESRLNFIYVIKYIKNALSVFRLLIMYLFLEASKPIFGFTVNDIDLFELKNFIKILFFFNILFILPLIIEYISSNNDEDNNNNNNVNNNEKEKK